MGLKKGQTNNKNGRPKGTKNKISGETKDWIKEIVDLSRNQIILDLKGVDSYKRLVILEKLMQYVVPKQQSISIEAQITAEFEALEKLLDKCPEDVIEKLTEKINQLNKINTENG